MIIKNTILRVVTDIFCTVRFACPVTTTHRVARDNIRRHNRSLERVQTAHLNNSYGRERFSELYRYNIRREEQVLAAPARLVFPTFFSFQVADDLYAVSLAGFRCNVPRLARRYGTECEVAGNALHYRNWLGSHWDL